MINALPINIVPPHPQIAHSDALLLVGSCFTEHIGKRLSDAKFEVLENPNGILFNPLSVVKSVLSWMENKPIVEEELFYLNEIWNHWDYHTRFSEMEKEAALKGINSSILQAHEMLRKADWLLITLGSAFQYFLVENDRPVANCHRAPGKWFEKKLLSIEAIKTALDDKTKRLSTFNPKLKIIYTISPVRHVRDGVVDNNRSKARLIEAVHETVAMHDNSFYFPAYELVIDVLRDYRYYDIDLVHPNFAATTAVWDVFFKHFLDEEAQHISTLMLALTTACNHKVRFPKTQAYATFQQNILDKIQDYEQRFPYINFSKEKERFAAI